MTERLYYTDSYKTEFDAEVVALTTVSHITGAEVDRKEVAAVELAATYFYPTSGGQAFDIGTLAGFNVLDVIAEKSDTNLLGRVLHLLDADAPTLANSLAPQQIVHGAVDWPRRYDHMQQHSGQHLLSHAFYKLLGHETVSVHFGALESTLDLAIDALDDDALRAIERYANEIVYANLPIKAYFVDEREIAALPLRRPPKVTGKIRVVEIEGTDYSACGGTHCRTTGELGPIKLVRTEKSRKNTRVGFVCGWRAHGDYVQKHRLLLDSANLLSTDITQVPISLERLLEQNKQLSRQLAGLTDELLAVEALKMAEMAQSSGAYRVVAQIFDDREIGEIKKLAGILQEQDDLVVLFCVCKEEQLSAIFARGADVPVEMGILLRDTLSAFGGSGGGRPEFAQGGKVNAAHAQGILDSALIKLNSDIG